MSKRFFQARNKGIEYHTVDDIAILLWALPELIPDYQASMYELAASFQAWRDYKGMRETLSFLVDVLIRIDELSDIDHLGEIERKI